MICYLPKTEEELSFALSHCTDHSRILAGGTDYIIQSRRMQYEPDVLVSLSDAAWLQGITITENEIRIGAAATMTKIIRFLDLQPMFGALIDAAANVGSPQIRNKGTIGGNLCNASPAGDMLPVCLLFDAKIDILDATGTVRSVSVEDFCLGPKKTCLQTGQAVVTIRFDRTSWKGYYSKFNKIGSRDYVSIARESLGVAVRLTQEWVIEDIRIVLGAVAPVPIRVKDAEDQMRNKKFEKNLIYKITPLIANAIHENCRPTNRLYKTEAARGLVADTLCALLPIR